MAAEDYAERGFSFVRLPYTRDEVLAISNLFPLDQRHVYLGAEAREETVKSEKLDDFRFIHFATHSFLDEIRPAAQEFSSPVRPNPWKTAFCRWVKSCA